jgi:hypothetical protein
LPTMAFPRPSGCWFAKIHSKFITESWLTDKVSPREPSFNYTFQPSLANRGSRGGGVLSLIHKSIPYFPVPIKNLPKIDILINDIVVNKQTTRVFWIYRSPNTSSSTTSKMWRLIQKHLIPQSIIFNINATQPKVSTVRLYRDFSPSNFAKLELFILNIDLSGQFSSNSNSIFSLFPVFVSTVALNASAKVGHSYCLRRTV